MNLFYAMNITFFRSGKFVKNYRRKRGAVITDNATNVVNTVLDIIEIQK